MAVAGLSWTDDARLAARLRRATQIASVLVFVLGATVCCGWLFGLPVLQRLHPRLVGMKLNTAIALMLLGAALRLAIDDGRRARASRVMALLALAIVVATLAEYGFGVDLGIDTLVCDDSSATGIPGRMSPVTAVALTGLGAAVAWLDARCAEWFGLLGALIAHVILLGYLYDVEALFSIGPVAAHTAIALYILSFGVIAARPRRGLMRVATSDSPGGVLARRLLPAAVALPAVLAMLRQWGEHAGLYDTGFGRAMLVTSNSVLFAILVWWTAVALSRADHDRRAAEAEVRDSETRRTAALESARGELMRSNDRLRVLTAASNSFAQTATSAPALLDQIARTIADVIGDGCHVTLLTNDDSQLIDVASAHRDPVLERATRAHMHGLTVSVATSSAIPAEVVRTGQAQRHDILPQDIVARSEPELRPVFAILDVHSLAVVPIRMRDAVIGALSVLRSGPSRSYTEEDLTLLQDLADRAGLALDSARLHDELEQRVRDRTHELETANKELEAFSYSVAHDLRSPLRGIAGFSRTVIDDYADRLPLDGVECLGRIEAGAQRMGQLIDDLLDVARVSRAELRRRPVDLSRMARTVVAQLQAAAPERSVEIVIEDGLEVDADPRLLDIVLTNLLDNAWKFTARSAQPRIELAVCTGTWPTTYVVHDNGAGFDPQYAAKLFGVFERLHPASEFEGTGIGLAIAQRIIDRHGGRIWAQSAVGQGAAIFLTLEPRRRRQTAR